MNSHEFLQKPIDFNAVLQETYWRNQQELPKNRKEEGFKIESCEWTCIKMAIYYVLLNC